MEMGAMFGRNLLLRELRPHWRRMLPVRFSCVIK